MGWLHQTRFARGQALQQKKAMTAVGCETCSHMRELLRERERELASIVEAAARLVQEFPDGEAAWALGEAIAPVEKRLNRSNRPSPSAQEPQSEPPASPHEVGASEPPTGS